MASATSTVRAAANEAEATQIRCAKFRQQELWAWKPVYTPPLISTMYLLVALAFIPIGVILFIQSSNLISTPKYRYDNVGSCSIGNTSSSTTAENCTVSFQVDRDIEAGSFFYYGMLAFYQNARTYVKSRSEQQLRGMDNPDTSACSPLEKFANGTLINPCGLAANSQFNDTFYLCEDMSCSSPLELNGTDIAWDIDQSTRYTENTSEDFMVWMRLAAYQDWKKLYRRIQSPLKKDTNYYVTITSSFPVEGFGGRKFFSISETSWFGGPNKEVALAYIITGGIAFILAIVLFIGSRSMKDVDLPEETQISLKGFVAKKELPMAEQEQLMYTA